MLRLRSLSCVAATVSLCGAAALPAPGSAAVPTSGWSTASAHPAARSNQTLALHPSASEAYSLTSSTLSNELDEAPLENTTAAAGTLPVISIPGPDGELHQFTVVESPVMEPALAAKVSTFHSYAVEGIDDPSASGRIDLSNLGFHASIHSALGAWYVDPAYRNSKTSYLSYNGRALTPDVVPPETESKEATSAHPAAEAVIPPNSLVKRRTYRLALARSTTTTSRSNSCWSPTTTCSTSTLPRSSPMRATTQPTVAARAPRSVVTRR